MQGNPDIDILMIPTSKAIKKHVKDSDAITEIYNRAYEAVIISMEVKDAGTLRWTKGGNGSHWDGCVDVHWDCRIAHLNAELAQLRAQIPQWIPVTERLPEKHRNILILEEGNLEATIGFLDHRGIFVIVDSDMNDTVFIDVTVTHWMPLPEVPE